MSPFCLTRLWKWQYPPQIRKLLKEVQLLKPHIVIGDGWYSFDEDDRYWWKNWRCENPPHPHAFWWRNIESCAQDFPLRDGIWFLILTKPSLVVILVCPIYLGCWICLWHSLWPSSPRISVSMKCLSYSEHMEKIKHWEHLGNKYDVSLCSGDMIQEKSGETGPQSGPQMLVIQFCWS